METANTLIHLACDEFGFEVATRVKKLMNEASQSIEFERFFNGYEHSIAVAAQSIAKDFKQFFEGFECEYLLARKQRVDTTPNLNVLQVFGLTTRELRHSDALAWFLREDAEHEQGDLFLRALLKDLKVSVPQQISYAVDREKHGNIDISVYARNKFALFFENKIRDRKEEDKQFERLVKSLNRFSDANGIPEHARIAIFLTDDGRSPVTAPEHSHNMRRVELFGVFSEALQKAPARSPLLVRFLENYRREIKLLL